MIVVIFLILFLCSFGNEIKRTKLGCDFRHWGAGFDI